MSAQRFAFAWDRGHRAASLLFGITPRTAYVEVGGGELLVRYGPWTLRTPLSNVRETSVIGGFAFLKTAGPPHLSFVDRGVSFATNGRTASCVQFHEPVKGIDPTGRILHPGATLTVEDPAALNAALAAASGA